MREWQSQAHVKWYCRYHVVIVPKYRRKSMFGAIRKDVGEMFRTLCGRFEVEGLLEVVWVYLDILERRQHAGQDVHAQVFLVSQSVCTSLDDADLVVQPFNETKRNFVLGFTVGGDPIPMSIDHLSEFLVGFQALPLQARSPVLEEPPCPALPLIAPQLPEGLLQHIRRVQSLVRCEQRLQRPATFQREVLPARQQRVLLTLDELAVLTFEPSVLGLAHLIERLAEVGQDVELVIPDRRVRCRLL